MALRGTVFRVSDDIPAGILIDIAPESVFIISRNLIHMNPEMQNR
jgi:hypothetical protein